MSEKKAVLCRNVKIGGGAPVSIQSMTNTPTADVKATMEQIRRLEEAGWRCRIWRQQEHCMISESRRICRL